MSTPRDPFNLRETFTEVHSSKQELKNVRNASLTFYTEAATPEDEKEIQAISLKINLKSVSRFGEQRRLYKSPMRPRHTMSPRLSVNYFTVILSTCAKKTNA